MWLLLAIGTIALGDMTPPQGWERGKICSNGGGGGGGCTNNFTLARDMLRGKNISVCNFVWKPYFYYENGDPVGFDIKLLNFLCSELGTGRSNRRSP